MTRYFAQNTPRAGLEHMMMSVPGFQKRGGGMMILSRFCYKPEDVDCRYCLHYRRRSCQVRTCPYIAERLKSGAIEYLDLILEYFGHIPHAGLHKRIQAVEHWSGPDQAVLHTVSVHLRSRFADRVWDDAPPGYHLSAREFARKIILDILQTTGITAAAGIGTNLYLAKVAMDIGAKHVPADEYGVRIAELDEMGYRRSFWTHRPLTDFWRVGKGYAAKLEAHGLYTMGDIARCSIGQPTDYHNEELLYKLFGVNAELLIDHAWGWEPCTIADIKAYKPENKSIVSGQILQYPYPFEKARLVIQEMADALALELVDKRLATNQLVLTVGYDIENLKGTAYTGEITTDHYGRKIPKHAHGTVNLDGYTSSGEELLKAATSLYDRIVDKTLLARRLTLCANHLLDESSVPEDLPEQIDLFTDYSAKEKQKKEADTAHARERKLQKTMLGIKKRFGKNAILKGLNLEDGATARERNNQIGGHKA